MVDQTAQIEHLKRRVALLETELGNVYDMLAKISGMPARQPPKLAPLREDE